MRLKLKKQLLKLHSIALGGFGIDLVRFLRSPVGFFYYFRDLIAFRRIYKGKLDIVPCVHDRFMNSAELKHEYFWQDLFVANRIYLKSPLKHTDVGSRVDGFVAHVASFRELDVYDFRPQSACVPNVNFLQGDFSLEEVSFKKLHPGSSTDSLSCLHTIEHFGLGRYGDPLDVGAVERGISNLSWLLSPNGTMYLATPIGRDRVEFNANYVFNPYKIISMASKVGLNLIDMQTIDSEGVSSVNFTDKHELSEIAANDYSLGLFVFSKD